MEDSKSVRQVDVDAENRFTQCDRQIVALQIKLLKDKAL